MSLREAADAPRCPASDESVAVGRVDLPLLVMLRLVIDRPPFGAAIAEMQGECANLEALAHRHHAEIDVFVDVARIDAAEHAGRLATAVRFGKVLHVLGLRAA